MTENYHDTLYNGESRTVEVTVTDEDGPMDLTNGSATWVLQASDGTEALRKESSGDITLTDPAEGKLTIAISATDSSGLAAEQHRHFLRVQDASGNVAVALRGRLNIQESPF